MKKSLFVISVLLLTVFGLSACGGGGASTTINVTFAEFTFTPSEFTIPAGQEITVNAKNDGAVAHDFVIMKFGKTVSNDFGDDDKPNVYWQIQVEPGASTTATFTAPTDPGTYQIVCDVPGHFVAGMSAKLTVVAAK